MNPGFSSFPSGANLVLSLEAHRTRKSLDFLSRAFHQVLFFFFSNSILTILFPKAVFHQLELSSPWSWHFPLVTTEIFPPGLSDDTSGVPWTHPGHVSHGGMESLHPLESPEDPFVLETSLVQEPHAQRVMLDPVVSTILFFHLHLLLPTV